MNCRQLLLNLQLQRVQEETKKELKKAPIINKINRVSNPLLNLKIMKKTQDQEETKDEP